MDAVAATPDWFVTPLAWAVAQIPHLPELLLEQAHLEKKAAASAMQFLFRVPAHHDALRALSALAREELVHFERTLRLLGARGIAYGSQPPSAYAARLKAAVASNMPERLVDELLVGAVIEARSHERMGLLAQALATVDREVAAFYSDLCIAEERHASLYVELAESVLPAEVVAARHRTLLRHEAAVLRELPCSPRLHSGIGGLSHG